MAVLRWRRAVPVALAAVALGAGRAGMAASPDDTGEWSVRQVGTNLQRTLVTDGDGFVARFTDGARTVLVRGPARVLREPGSAVRVVSTTRVRLLPTAFTGAVDRAWLTDALADTTPDLLDVALQYTAGTPTQTGADGERYAGPAHYGQGADFYDYLGLEWTFPDGVSVPDPDLGGDLDDAGFLRTVFGYRGGYPMSDHADGTSIPRGAEQIAELGPGPVVAMTVVGLPWSSLHLLQPGDILGFDLDHTDAGHGGRVDTVGLFVGQDTHGHLRFVASLPSTDGPSMSDAGTPHVVDGVRGYAPALRIVHRL